MKRLALLLLTAPLAAQQADSITISRFSHDLAWAAAGTAGWTVGKELGIRSPVLRLVVPLGMNVLKLGIHCANWCGKGIWPARVALKDAARDLLIGAAVPLAFELGKGHAWRGLLSLGLAGFSIRITSKWGSP